MSAQTVTPDDVTAKFMSAGYGVVHSSDVHKDHRIHIWHLVQAKSEDMATTELGPTNVYPYPIVREANAFSIAMDIGQEAWPAAAIDSMDILAGAERQWGPHLQ